MAKTNTSPNTEVVSSAETEVIEGTTDQLFGQSTEETAPIGKGVENAVAEGEKAVTQETKADPPKAESLSSEDFSGRTVKTKVDGVEKEISFEELLKGYQLNETIADRGQKLGQERRTIAEERKTLEELRAKVEGLTQASGLQPQAQPNVDFDMLDETTRSVLQAQKAEYDTALSNINKQLQQIAVGLEPIQVDQAYKKIDASLKAENPAYSDFLGRTAEIESVIINMPPENQAEYSTQLGYMSIYKDLKLREANNPSPEGDGVAKLIPRTESGGGTPTGVDAGELSKKKALFDKAVEASRMKDIRDFQQVDPMKVWAEVLDDIG